MKNRHSHLWIPNEEILHIENKPTAREHHMPVDFSEHGVTLIDGLNAIESFHNKNNSPILNEYIIFKLRLYPNQKLSTQKRKDFIEKSGLEIKFIKNNETAIVAASLNKFELLRKKASSYQQKNRYSDFEYIDCFEYIGKEEKQSNHLRGIIDNNNNNLLDIQIQLIPNFDNNIYKKSINYLSSLITASEGTILDKPYYLSDNTPIIRASVEPSMIDLLSENEIVFAIENTNFFNSTPSTEKNEYRFDDVKLNPDIILDNLPVVGILDSGVNFGSHFLNNFVVDKYVSPGITSTNYYHGTGCAFRAMFGTNFILQKNSGALSPRVRIVDGIISDGIHPIPTSTFIERIKKSIHSLKQYTSIFNLSFNSEYPIDGDLISIVGYELDCIMKNENVQIIVSSGNHKLYRLYNNLNDILDDDDSRIAAPADSVHALTVGSYCISNDSNCISKQFDIAPYSRVGFGLGGRLKPDIVAPGGNIFYDAINNKDIISNSDPALIPLQNGRLISDCGTSYAAPIVAGDLAIIQKSIPSDLNTINNKILLSKTLLIHTSDYFHNFDDLNSTEKDATRRIYGNGHSNIEKALFSSDNRVTFIRTGTMDYNYKQRVKFYMPSNMAEQSGLRTCKITVTCLCDVPFRRDKGTEYVSAYISASLKKIDTKFQLKVGNPRKSDGRHEWVCYQHFSNIFSDFNPGNWQIWLQMHKRWDIEKDDKIEYALAVTIEDLTGTNNIYQSIIIESNNRFRPINEVRVRT